MPQKHVGSLTRPFKFERAPGPVGCGLEQGPGHRRAIGDFRARIGELVARHAARNDEVVSILESGSRCAYDVAVRMSWDIRADSWQDLPLMQRWFATGEAIAHLRSLAGTGRVRSHVADGRILYSTPEARGA